MLALMPTGPPTRALGFATVCLRFAMLCSSTWLPPDSGPRFWNFPASSQCTNWLHGSDLLAIYHILYTPVLGPTLWSAPQLPKLAGNSLIFTPSIVTSPGELLIEWPEVSLTVAGVQLANLGVPCRVPSW